MTGGFPAWTIRRVAVDLTVDTDAYDNGDVIGGLLTAAVNNIQGGGFIQKVQLVDDAAQSEPLMLYVYDDAPHTIADGAAFAPTDADNLHLLGRVSIAAADYYTQGDGKVVSLPGYDYEADGDHQEYIHFDNPANGKLRLYLVANGGTPDYVAETDLHLILILYLT